MNEKWSKMNIEEKRKANRRSRIINIIMVALLSMIIITAIIGLVLLRMGLV
jgi:cell division protein FtsB